MIQPEIHVQSIPEDEPVYTDILFLAVVVGPLWYRTQELNRSILIVLLAVVSVSCNRTMPARAELSNSQQQDIQHYLEAADHLDENQRQAMREGKPFIGMTYEQAIMVMPVVEREADFDGKILEAEFRNRAGQGYILFFDGGVPNRVRNWSAYTDKESEEFTRFRDVHPCPPLALPRQIKK